jgi:PBS lyase HEAT-like repeat
MKSSAPKCLMAKCESLGNQHDGFRKAAVQFAFLFFLALSMPSLSRAQPQSTAELLERFNNTKVFWQQFEVAGKIVEVGDRSVLVQLEPRLADDRHLRGNAAFIFASLGDSRGFEVITAVLNDRSDRREGQGLPGGRWSLEAQIAADRYYAIHVLGEIKDRRAIPLLAPLLNDEKTKMGMCFTQVGPTACGFAFRLYAASAERFRRTARARQPPPAAPSGRTACPDFWISDG